MPVARPDELAHDLVAARTHDPRVAVGARILRRLDTSGAPGLGAVAFSRRFAQRHLRLEAIELTVSPYAPPQRQLSAVRQGAPMWPPAQPASAADSLTHSSQRAPSGAPKATPQDANQLPPDLKALLELHRSRGTI